MAVRGARPRSSQCMGGTGATFPHHTHMVSTITNAPPIQPKRGMLLVAMAAPKDETSEGGIILPPEISDRVKRARVVALGKEPRDIRTGQPTAWDYAIGDTVILREDVPVMSLPYKFERESLALISEAHIAGLWVGEL